MPPFPRSKLAEFRGCLRASALGALDDDDAAPEPVTFVAPFLWILFESEDPLPFNATDARRRCEADVVEDGAFDAALE